MRPENNLIVFGAERNDHIFPDGMIFAKSRNSADKVIIGRRIEVDLLVIVGDSYLEVFVLIDIDA